jgi:branched-chain amino acid transport system permease protein
MATLLYPRSQYGILATAVAILIVLAQVVTKSSSVNLLNLWVVYSIAGLGFYWIFALGGRFAFSQTFMMALGGYTTAYLDSLGLPFVACVLGAVAVTGLGGVAVGLVLWRTEHFYFALGTLAVAEIGAVVFGRTSTFTGVNGNITGVGYPRIFDYELRTDNEVFWLLAFVLIVVLLLTVWARRSAVSRQLEAVREIPVVARTVGVQVDSWRLRTLVFGSSIGGLSGALITHWQGFIGVDSFGLDLGIGLFLIVILGGLASHWGVLAGAAFYVLVPELLSGLQQYMSVLYGALLLVVILVFPGGLSGLLDKLVPKRPGTLRSREKEKS